MLPAFYKINEIHTFSWFEGVPYHSWFIGVVVIMSALNAEGPGSNSQMNYDFFEPWLLTWACSFLV